MKLKLWFPGKKEEVERLNQDVKQTEVAVTLSETVIYLFKQAGPFRGHDESVVNSNFITFGHMLLKHYVSFGHSTEHQRFLLISPGIHSC